MGLYDSIADIRQSSPTAVGPNPMSAAMYSARNCAPEPAPIDWLNSTSNFFAGWGDMLSLGATGRIRQWIGVDDVVDRSSGAYRGGEIVGTVHDLAMAAGALKQAGRVAGRMLRGTKGLVEVTHWFPKGAVAELKPGMWMMRGGKNWWTYLRSGVYQRGPSPLPYAYRNAIVRQVGKQFLRWPIAEEGSFWGFLKGLMGQRIYTGPIF